MRCPELTQQLLWLSQPACQLSFAFLVPCLCACSFSISNSLSHHYCQGQKSNCLSNMLSCASLSWVLLDPRPLCTHAHKWWGPLSFQWSSSDFLRSYNIFLFESPFLPLQVPEDRCHCHTIYAFPWPLVFSGSYTITSSCDSMSAFESGTWALFLIPCKWQVPSGRQLNQ